MLGEAALSAPADGTAVIHLAKEDRGKDHRRSHLYKVPKSGPLSRGVTVPPLLSLGGIYYYYYYYGKFQLHTEVKSSSVTNCL